MPNPNFIYAVTILLSVFVGFMLGGMFCYSGFRRDLEKHKTDADRERHRADIYSGMVVYGTRNELDAAVQSAVSQAMMPKINSKVTL